jgi:hypothetical protein
MANRVERSTGLNRSEGPFRTRGVVLLQLADTLEWLAYDQPTQWRQLDIRSLLMLCKLPYIGLT